MKFLIGRKLKMSQVFEEDGTVVPVTLVKTGPCHVTQVKTEENDGYEAVQIGYEKLEPRKVKKPLKDKPYRFLREWRGESDLEVGDEVDVTVFEKGDTVNVKGVSKGKGYAGAVKRWGFVEKAKAHGAKDMRRVGATGSRFPQRTPKGRKMPGRMGSDTVTVQNLEIVRVDEENDTLAVKGAVPGSKGSLVEVMGR